MSHTESSAQRGAWRERCVFEDKKTKEQLIKSQTEETNNTICQKNRLSTPAFNTKGK